MNSSGHTAFVQLRIDVVAPKLHKSHVSLGSYFVDFICVNTADMYILYTLIKSIPTKKALMLEIIPFLELINYYIQLTLVISNSLISNNPLSRSENLVPA